ncbi:MAG: hypothetical protein ACPLZG_10655, partial [Thermoproteota archaeon]
MVLRDNIYYWNESLKHPEPVLDSYYIFDEIIVSDKNLIQKVERLRELIISYCVMIEKDKNAASKILDEIHSIIISTDKIQYTEFAAFWKVLDISYSVLKELTDQKFILEGLLQEYCKRRRKLYDELGYSNVTVQALYDSGASRKKGSSGIEKLVDLMQKIFSNMSHVKNLHILTTVPIGYFLPDKGDKNLFKEFCRKYNIRYEFGKAHQEKEPDIVLKVKDHFFIMEAKHIKESGGAQDKQIVEAIEFIKYSENSNNIHYLSFMDGVYFNNFIWIRNDSSKVSQQKADIEKYLNENKSNFFVNTGGLIIL